MCDGCPFRPLFSQPIILIGGLDTIEDLVLHVQIPREMLLTVRNAGSVYLGSWSAESAGDYCSGTNHVLPTFGHARSYSGLTTGSFMRHMTVQEITAEGLRGIGPAVVELAMLEGLDAHAQAMRCRLKEPN
jgi:histidinol dehydrogenase